MAAAVPTPRCPRGPLAAERQLGEAAGWPALGSDGECSACAPLSSRQVTPGSSGALGPPLHAALAALPHFGAAAAPAGEGESEDEAEAAGRMAACARRLALGAARAAPAAAGTRGGEAQADRAAGAPGL
ncbi:unnamed protein product [Prorocentrum cordatum]|uniref:Uncharacterized protein n=1 Tax=Prorocentrum cordatum TaxID=2364126 RepID=A0ABN9X8G6_9DINO|nr:unnamed protein product [Polarella glacialis]